MKAPTGPNKPKNNKVVSGIRQICLLALNLSIPKIPKLIKFRIAITINMCFTIS